MNEPLSIVIFCVVILFVYYVLNSIRVQPFPYVLVLLGKYWID